MATAQPQRPGAPARRPAGPAQTTQSAEVTNNLPEFIEDGQAFDLNPELANDGGLGAGDGTTVSITKARFGKFEYPGRPDISAEIRLFVSLKREGFDTDREESMKYGDFSRYVATKDGNFVRLRPSAIKKNKDGSDYIPKPFKYDKAVMFLQSLKDAGLSADAMNKEGAKALVGLTVHVRKTKVAGQSPTAKPVLVVDYIGGKTPAGSPAPKTEVPKSATVSDPGQSSEVDALATDAMLDILGQAEGNKISRAQIPTTLIRLDKWKSHEQRGAILKTLRDDAFVNQAGAAWKVSGNEVSL